MFEFACHEGNYALSYGLMGARTHDSAEGAKQ
jgi:hypothetical protein